MGGKKSQLVIISMIFIVFALLFIYSAGIINVFKEEYRKDYLVENIKYETCQVARISNGSFIDTRLQEFSSNVFNYCLNKGCYCNLTVYKSATAPTNLSLLNYSYYEFGLNYSCMGTVYDQRFKC